VNDRLGGFARRPNLLQLWTATADSSSLARVDGIEAGDVLVVIS
jgi:hypothetical protein